MSNLAKEVVKCIEGDSNYPLCIALDRLENLELLTKDAKKLSGLVKKEDVIQLLQDLELAMIVYLNERHDLPGGEA